MLNSYKIIYDILLLGDGKISLCGGSLISLISHGQNNGDWDMFFHCDSIDEADELLYKCSKYIEIINHFF